MSLCSLVRLGFRRPQNGCGWWYWARVCAFYERHSVFRGHTKQVGRKRKRAGVKYGDCSTLANWPSCLHLQISLSCTFHFLGMHQPSGLPIAQAALFTPPRRMVTTATKETALITTSADLENYIIKNEKNPCPAKPFKCNYLQRLHASYNAEIVLRSWQCFYSDFYT